MINIRYLGIQPYAKIWEEMKQFTATRDETTCDELWLLEHPAVYTQGQAGKPEHVLKQHSIPIIQSDRGGQVTYHGPGQLVAYTLLDIGRRKLGIRALVNQLEQILILLLKKFAISAQTRSGAPGVYVDEKKIASIGLRVKKNRTYHGLALNVAMDLSPFSYINPCGFAQLQMTQMQDFRQDITIEDVGKQFAYHFLTFFEH